MGDITKDNTCNFIDGEYLFRQGDEAESIFLVEAGLVKIFKEDKNHKIELATIQEGEVIGTLSLLGKRRSASAQAHGAVQCREFKTKILLKGSANIPKWYQTMLKEIVGRFENLEERYIKLTETVYEYESGTMLTSPASVHIAQLLLTLHGLKVFTSTSEILHEERFCVNFCGPMGLSLKTFRSIIVGFKRAGFLTSPPAGMLPILHNTSEAMLTEYIKTMGTHLKSRSTKNLSELNREQYAFLKSLTDVYCMLIAGEKNTPEVNLDQLLEKLSRHTGLTGGKRKFATLPSEWKLSIINPSQTDHVLFEEAKFRRKIATAEMMKYISELDTDSDQ